MPLRLSNLSYQVGDKPLVKNLDWELADGALAAVSGPTGVGKTTLGLLAAKVLPATFSESDLPRGLNKQWRYLVGDVRGDLKAPSPSMYIPSNPMETLIFPSVSDELESITTDSSAINHALLRVGLDKRTVGYNVLGRELYQLLGGMLQRLAMARLFLQRERLKLVVADEAYDWLDDKGQVVFKEILGEIAQRGGISIALQSTAASSLDGFSQFSLNGGIKTRVTSLGSSTWGASRIRRPIEDVVLQLQSVSKKYPLPEDRHDKWISILSDVSLIGHRGEWIGVYGPNGIGKSVLSRIISGLEKEDRGSIVLNGSPTSPGKRRRTVGYVFQFPSMQLPLPSLSNILDQTIPKERHTVIYATLEGLVDTDKKVLEMTPCEQRLVLLAILLARNIDVLIIDEPTWGSDEKETQRILTFLAEHNDSARLTIIVSHNSRLLNEVCDRRYELREGVLKETTDARN